MACKRHMLMLTITFYVAYKKRAIHCANIKAKEEEENDQRLADGEWRQCKYNLVNQYANSDSGQFVKH